MKAKQLTNIRAAGSDENIILTPPIRFDLEQALEFIDDDELVEITPKAIRLRKKLPTNTNANAPSAPPPARDRVLSAGTFVAACRNAAENEES